MEKVNTIKRLPLTLPTVVREGELLVRGADARAETSQKRPRIARNLHRLESWQRELSNIYRGMRYGEIPPEQATRATYIAEKAARVTKDCQMILEIRRLREELSRLDVQVSDDLDTYLEAESA
jgi:hypothetical protein